MLFSFESARARIKEGVKDPEPLHPRVRAVYAVQDGWGSEGTAHRTTRDSHGDRLSREEDVLLAQLRTGHCPALAAYRAIYTPGLTPPVHLVFRRRRASSTGSRVATPWLHKG